MTRPEGVEWTGIYETRSATDADLVRTTLEVAGYRVSVEGAGAPASFIPSYDASGKLTISVPAKDADDARDFLRHKTSLVTEPPSPTLLHEGQADTDEAEGKPDTVADAATEILDQRRQHEVAACKYCGI